jgi:hypothetical protein
VHLSRSNRIVPPQPAEDQNALSRITPLWDVKTCVRLGMVLSKRTCQSPQYDGSERRISKGVSPLAMRVRSTVTAMDSMTDNSHRLAVGHDKELSSSG